MCSSFIHLISTDCICSFSFLCLSNTPHACACKRARAHTHTPMKWKVSQSCPTICNPMDCSLTGSFVHGIFQTRILEWIAISFSRGSSRPRDWTQVSCTAGRLFTVWAPREAHIYTPQLLYPFICWWASMLLPCPSCCKQCCNEHCGMCVFFNYDFLSAI